MCFVLKRVVFRQRAKNHVDFSRACLGLGSGPLRVFQILDSGVLENRKALI